MPKVPVHHHPCQMCGGKTECSGTWAENYGGRPAVVCDVFHERANGFMENPDFRCAMCEALTEAEREAVLEMRLGIVAGWVVS